MRLSVLSVLLLSVSVSVGGDNDWIVQALSEPSAPAVSDSSALLRWFNECPATSVVERLVVETTQRDPALVEQELAHTALVAALGLPPLSGNNAIKASLLALSQTNFALATIIQAQLSNVHQLLLFARIERGERPSAAYEDPWFGQSVCVSTSRVTDVILGPSRAERLGRRPLTIFDVEEAQREMAR